MRSRSSIKRIAHLKGEKPPAFIKTQEEMKEAAKGRSPNYELLTPEEQWDEDKHLGILDWDGK